METAYVGRRRNGQLTDGGRAGRHAPGIEPAPVWVNEHLAVIGGLWRQYSVTSRRHYWSADGNNWHGSPEAARAARVTP